GALVLLPVFLDRCVLGITGCSNRTKRCDQSAADQEPKESTLHDGPPGTKERRAASERPVAVLTAGTLLCRFLPWPILPSRSRARFSGSSVPIRSTPSFLRWTTTQFRPHRFQTRPQRIL